MDNFLLQAYTVDMNLFPHQKELLDLNPDRYLLAHGTGTGKTLMAIELAKKRNGLKLIICPKHLKEKWTRDVPGTWMILSKEEFKKRSTELGDFSTVIVDEAHTFFGIKSQLHKSLMKYFKRYDTRYRYLLTATPYLSTPWNIYAAAVLLGHDINYRKFQYKFFHEIRMGHRFVWKAKEDQHSKDLLKSLVGRLGSSVQLDDVFDVPHQHHEVVLLQMTPEQEKAIAENYDPVAIVQWTAQHRIENQGDPKLAWILEFAKTHKKFVIWCRYLDQLHEYKNALNKKGYLVAGVHGGIDFRQALFEVMDPKDRGILVIQAQCSEGYELPHFDTAVYASMSFSYKDLVQSQGRLLRANALHENNYYYLIMEGGVDEEVWKALKNKEDFSFSLLEKKLSTKERNK